MKIWTRGRDHTIKTVVVPMEGETQDARQNKLQESRKSYVFISYREDKFYLKVFTRKGEIATYGSMLTEKESLHLMLKSDYHHNVRWTAWEVFKDYFSNM